VLVAVLLSSPEQLNRKYVVACTTKRYQLANIARTHALRVCSARRPRLRPDTPHACRRRVAMLGRAGAGGRRPRVTRVMQSPQAARGGHIRQ